MKRKLVHCASAWILSIASALAVDSAPAATPAEEAVTVRSLAFAKAALHGDLATFPNFMSDDYVMLWAEPATDGKKAHWATKTKKQWVEELGSKKNQYHSVELLNAKTILIETDQYDVFGDGSVVIKFAPGHTPGHQMLLLRLKNTGPVLLSGDLYHFPQERTLNRFPVFEFDKEQTRRTRVEIDEFLKATGASLWIQHDFIGNSKLRKSPAFYD